MRTIFVSGTDTDVGKTLVSAALAYAISKSGNSVGYLKPALSGAIKNGDSWIPEDTQRVCETAGIDKAYELMTPFCYEASLSPHLAARLEGNPLSPAVVLTHLESLQKKYSHLIVEGAGGIACPLFETQGHYYMTTDLIQEMNLPVVLVCRAGLGTLNHTITAVSYAKSQGIQVKGLIVSGYENNIICNDNLDALPKLTGLPVLAVLPKLDLSIGEAVAIREAVDTHWPIDALMHSLFSE